MTPGRPLDFSYAPSGDADDDHGATAEPILLTDPDGTVIRVDPWSTWSREQRRAPGGEPALLTRLSEGQLWFSAGSTGSPWRQEVHVGPAVVSTPRGRFHAIADDDGGATITCLVGRTRVATALREPLLLDTHQRVGVSSDGATLVVINRGPEPGLVPSAPAVVQPVRERRSRLPAAAAVVALVAVLLGVAFAFGRQVFPRGPVTAPLTFSAPTQAQRGGEGPGAAEPTMAIGDTDVRGAVVEANVVEAAPVISTSGATGHLVACRRSDTGVVVVVDVSHRAGEPERFTIDVALVDRTGTVFATGTARSPVIEPATSSTIEVPVDARSGARGTCELTGITAS